MRKNSLRPILLALSVLPPKKKKSPGGFGWGIPIFVVSRESIGYPRLRHVKHLLQGAGRAIFGSGAWGFWCFFSVTEMLLPKNTTVTKNKHLGCWVGKFFVQENGTNKNPTPLNLFCGNGGRLFFFEKINRDPRKQPPICLAVKKRIHHLNFEMFQSSIYEAMVDLWENLGGDFHPDPGTFQELRLQEMLRLSQRVCWGCIPRIQATEKGSVLFSYPELLIIFGRDSSELNGKTP